MLEMGVGRPTKFTATFHCGESGVELVLGSTSREGDA